jgi:multiple sugar transport system substrate-binding protein
MYQGGFLLKNRFKSGLVLLVCLAIAGLFFGCSKEKQQAATDVITIKTWNKPAPGDPSIELREQLIKKFEEQNPGIKVVDEYRGAGVDYRRDFLTAMRGGEGPDLWLAPTMDVPTYIAEGLTADITEFVNKWSNKDKVYPTLWEGIESDGKYYGVPNGSYVMTLFYRKDLFEQAGLDPNQPPKNWDELVEYAKRLTEPSKPQFGFGLLGMDWCAWHWMNFVWQAGGEMVVQEEDGSWKAAFDSPAGEQALAFYHDLRWKHGVVQADVLAAYDDLIRDFATGRIAMMFFAPEMYQQMRRKYGMKAEVLGIAPLPAGPTGIKAAQMGGNSWIINPNKPKKVQEAAWKLIEFLLDEESIIETWKFNEEHDLLTPANSIYQDLNQADYVKIPSDWSEAMGEGIKFGRPEPNPPKWDQVKQYLVTPIQTTLTNKNATNYKKLLADCARKVNVELFGQKQ